MSTILRPDQMEDRAPDVFTHQPRREGRRLLPLRTFTVCQQGRFAEIHQGFGLSAEMVIADQVESGEDLDAGSRSRPYDVAIFADECLVARVHCPAGPAGTVVRPKNWTGA